MAVPDFKDIDLPRRRSRFMRPTLKHALAAHCGNLDNLKALLLPYSATGPVALNPYRQKFEAVSQIRRDRPWPRNAMRYSAASYHLVAHGNESPTQAMLGL
jgi:hypothetical protein